MPLMIPPYRSPRRSEGRVQPEAELGREGLARVRGADRVDDVRDADRLAQHVDAPRVADRVGEVQLPRLRPGRPPVVREVVARQDGRRPRRAGPRALQRERQERRACLPIVPVHDVDRGALDADGLERGAPEQRESRRVVGVVEPTGHVIALAVEGGGVLDQPQAVAVGLPGPDRHGLRGGAADADLETQRLQGSWRFEAAVPGQVDVHVMTRTRRRGRPQRAAQGVDDVREPAGLGEGLAFGADHHDAHRSGHGRSAMTPCGVPAARCPIALPRPASVALGVARSGHDPSPRPIV